MAWRAKADSSEGVSHRRHGIPCQDCTYYDCVGEIVIGAVADGAGSAKRAEESSQITVKVATEYLRDWVQSQSKQLATVGFQSQRDAEQVFSAVLERVVAVLQAEALQSGYHLSDYACTLLLFIAAPDWIAAMQLGDGFIVVKPRHDEYQLLFQPDKGEFANETTFVTSTNARYEMKIRIDDGVQEFICASTDGLERVAINLSNWQPSPRFFGPLQEYIGEQEHVDKEPDYLESFLDSDRLNERTDDDKSLLLCFYDPSIPPSSDRPGRSKNKRVPPTSNDDQRNVPQTLAPVSISRVPTRFLLVQCFILNLIAGALAGWLTPLNWAIKAVAFLVFILAALLTWVWSFGSNLLKWLTASLCVIVPGILILDVIKNYNEAIAISKTQVGQISERAIIQARDTVSSLANFMPEITQAVIALYLPIALATVMSIVIFTTVLVLPTTPRKTFTRNFRLTISTSFTGFFVGLLLLFLIGRS